YEQTKRIGSVSFYAGEVPTFTGFAKRYLAEDTAHLAPTTHSDRKSYLRESGPLLDFFGSMRLDEIHPPLIRAWLNEEVQEKGRSIKTGKCYLDVLGALLGYATELHILSESPVPRFRESLRKRLRTQRGRAERDPARHICPIADAAEVRSLVEAAQTEGLQAYVLVLLLLDGGLRLGEALGLRWGAIVWCSTEDDPRRALIIDRARPRGGEVGLTKSGRARRVSISRRLRRALSELYRAALPPEPDPPGVGKRRSH